MNWPMCSPLIDDENVSAIAQHGLGVLVAQDLVAGARTHEAAVARDDRDTRLAAGRPLGVGLAVQPVDRRRVLGEVGSSTGAALISHAPTVVRRRRA